jgi:hypothetical protein
MDGYLVKSEKEGEGTVMDATAATIQQMLANSGVLMSQLQLLSSGDGSAASAAASLPWMAVSPYQMVVLPQSLLAAQNISATTQDGQIVLTSSAVNDAQGTKNEHTASTLDQAMAVLLQKQDKNAAGTVGSSAVAMHSTALSQMMKEEGRDGEPNQKMAKLDGDHGGIKPPKKPLTPYMTFSKMVGKCVYFIVPIKPFSEILYQVASTCKFFAAKQRKLCGKFAVCSHYSKLYCKMYEMHKYFNLKSEDFL